MRIITMNFCQKTFTEALGLSPGETAAIVGCGGKTGLMLRLAEENRSEKTLISTTAHILRPPPGSFDREYTPESGGVKALPGVTLVYGSRDADGKLLPWPEPDFAGICRLFDRVFLECDGSKTLPLKGWAEHEPAVPVFASATVGVCALTVLGKPVDEGFVHRPELFCRLTGAEPGRPVELGHIAAMVSAVDGMFRRSAGRRILFINQVEDAGDMALARRFVDMLPEVFLQGLSAVCAGSVYRGEIVRL